MQTVGTRLANLLISVATAVVVVALVIPLFLNPWWVAFEQGRAEATAWTGFSEPDLRVATDSILSDLVIGPPDFDVAVAGAPVLNEREQGHMRDVRGVFIVFFAVAGLVALGAALVVARRRGSAELRRASWRAVRAGAIGLIAGLIAAGTFALVAFDTLFEIFHQLVFAGGSYTFDPATERLVQLFPFAFWQETSIVLGIVCIVLAAVVALLADRRARAPLEPAAAPAAQTAGPEPAR